ncbi:MAG: biotin/lipoyl-binding protein, partial [Bacteroidota bacterium]
MRCSSGITPWWAKKTALVSRTVARPDVRIGTGEWAADTAGRVDEVFVTNNQDVQAGEPIFRLNGDRQEAAAETARRRIS